jgi:hypothetical protein
MNSDFEIYFHVGLGKVASSYLQQRVFPKLENITYIPTNKYKQCKEIIAERGPGKYLISREFDRQFEREVRWFTKTYPDTHIIILFRDHGSWIASQYRRYVKNGWYWDFEKFFDLKSDGGFWKTDQLFFYPKLEIIESCTDKKPLVLFHEELKGDPWVFFDKISRYANATYSKEKISLSQVHKSYTEKQLLVLRTFCRKYVRYVPRGKDNMLHHWLTFRPWWAFFHLIMYVAALFPKAWVPEESLIDKAYLDEINKAYSADWKRLKAYALKNNPK